MMSEKDRTTALGCGVIVAVVAVVVLIILAAAGERVEAGTDCVKREFGKATGTTGTGWEWMTPGQDSLRCYQTSLITLEYTGQGSRADYHDDVIRDPSADGVPVAMAAYVEFRIQPGALVELHDTAYRTTDAVVTKIVQPQTRATVREVITETPIEAIYPGGKTTLSRSIEARLIEVLGARGIDVVSFNLTAIDPDDAYEQAVSDQQQAAEDAALARQQQIVAEEQAEKDRIEAAGQAQVQRELAQGEADANAILTESVTPEILQLEYFQTLRSANWAILSPGEVMPTLPIATPAPEEE